MKLASRPSNTGNSNVMVLKQHHSVCLEETVCSLVSTYTAEAAHVSNVCVWLVATVQRVFVAVYSRCIWRRLWKMYPVMSKMNWTAVKKEILRWVIISLRRVATEGKKTCTSKRWTLWKLKKMRVTKTTDYLPVHQCCSWLTAGQYWSANPAPLFCRPIANLVSALKRSLMPSRRLGVKVGHG